MLLLASSSSQTDSVKLERKGRACEIASVEVIVDIIHTSVNDLQVSLEHDGTTVMLLEDACSTSDPPTIEMGIRFDDTTRSVPVAKTIPETCEKPLVGRYRSYNLDGTSLLDFVGNLGQGTWTLNVTRNGSEGAEDGFLLSWTIGIACAANGSKSTKAPTLRSRGKKKKKAKDLRKGTNRP
jgi:subtilisin-like proprotein convertase family protein